MKGKAKKKFSVVKTKMVKTETTTASPPPSPKPEDSSIPKSEIPKKDKAPAQSPPPQIPSPPLETLSSNPNPDPNPSSSSAAPAANVDKRKMAGLRPADLRRVSIADPANAPLLRDSVRRARILYESIRTSLLQQDGRAGRRSRADLDAAARMKDAGLWLNQESGTVGFIPGIHIGDVFFYRVELCVLGVHGQHLACVDFLSANQSSSGEPIATSVIFSGGYEDDNDRGDVVVYTGQGGGERKRSRKLEGGNLALERSQFHNIEVRVIRGLSCERSPTKKIYVYEGLYNVAEWRSEVGGSGFTVYKFKLVRMEGQEMSGSAAIGMAKEAGRAKGYLSRDISKGKERQPVAVFNDIDEDKYPLEFDYVVRPVFMPIATLGAGGSGCKCRSDCSAGCECVEKNGGPAYDDSGRLLRGRPVVYECGKNCGCPKTCANRVSQQGLRHRLEVFRSLQTDWGVRSLDFILAGEFVCEFTGVLLTKQETEVASASSACLVYPDRLPRRWEEWGDSSLLNPDCERPKLAAVPDLGYDAIDVSKSRNVACYLAHDCNPNVFLQYVHFNQFNVEYPRTMVFAMENIPPLRELSLDHGSGDE